MEPPCSHRQRQGTVVIIGKSTRNRNDGTAYSTVRHYHNGESKKVNESDIDGRQLAIEEKQGL